MAGEVQAREDTAREERAKVVHRRHFVGHAHLARARARVRVWVRGRGRGRGRVRVG